MTAPVSVPDVLAHLEEARAKATPGKWSNPYPFTKLIDAPGSTDNLAIVQCDSAADAACIVAEHNATGRQIAAVRAVLELADGQEAATGDVKNLSPTYREHCGWHANLIRTALASALAEEEA